VGEAGEAAEQPAADEFDDSALARTQPSLESELLMGEPAGLSPESLTPGERAPSPFDILGEGAMAEAARSAAETGAAGAEAAEPGEQDDGAPTGREVYTLLVLREGRLVRDYELSTERKHLLGSNPAADIVVDDPKVGPIQARLLFADGSFRVRNLNLVNKLRIDGRECEEAPLEPGSVMELGSTEFRLKRELKRVL
jgi:hypothetical protein